MANKKFHFNDRKTEGRQESRAEGRPDARREGVSRTGGRRPQKNGGAGKAARRSEIMEAVYSKYPADKLAIPVAALGVTEELVGLLSLKGITTAGDLVSRTERDMFKVQGFNKKMLLALKRGLEREGMSFYAEEASAPRKSESRNGTEQRRRESRQPEQKAVAQKLKILTENPFYPSLRTKKVQGLDNVFEMSVNMDIVMLSCNKLQ